MISQWYSPSLGSSVASSTIVHFDPFGKVVIMKRQIRRSKCRRGRSSMKQGQNCSTSLSNSPSSVSSQYSWSKYRTSNLRFSEIQCPIFMWINSFPHSELLSSSVYLHCVCRLTTEVQPCTWSYLNISVVTICSLIFGQYGFPFKVLSMLCSSVSYRPPHVQLPKKARMWNIQLGWPCQKTVHVDYRDLGWCTLFIRTIFCFQLFITLFPSSLIPSFVMSVVAH